MEAPSQNPETPQRGRRRYPAHLGKADGQRVPLHRRGTSRTYERLEDLLREAGYKETRVFTPEAERLEAEAEERREREQERQVSNGGVGAVVNFLSGFIPKNASANATGKTQSLGRAGGRLLERVLVANVPISTPPSPSPKTTSLYQTSPLTQSSLHSSSSSLSSKPSNLSIRTSRPQLSAAQSALRHMASAPSMPPPAEAKSRRSIDQNNPDAPPLPPNWLQVVTQAVAGYGSNSGAHIGRPSSRSGRVTPRHRASDLAISRSQSQRPVLRNHATNGASRLGIVDGANKLAPQHSYSQRACSCTGTVTTTSVVCRSAPSSRASSHVRGKDKDVRLPSLGITSVEGEPWPNSSMLPHGPGKGAGQGQVESDESSEDEDIGELDLARILVPAKRQKSIRSLRQHLHRGQTNGNPAQTRPNRRPGPRPSGSSSNSALNSLRSSIASSSNPDVDDSFEVELQRDFERRRRGSVDENDEDAWAETLPGLERLTTKKRGQLPWVSWTQGKL